MSYKEKAVDFMTGKMPYYLLTLIPYGLYYAQELGILFGQEIIYQRFYWPINNASAIRLVYDTMMIPS